MSLTAQQIQDIVTVSFEGGGSGTDSWAEIMSYVKPENLVVPAEYDGYPFYSFLLLFGGYIVLVDIEDEEVREILTMGKLYRGLEKVKAMRPNVYQRLVDGEYDAVDADILVQTALFGEVVYG